MKRNLAIIPARSGSKGLPDKNIRLLNGRPLIAYTIDAALQSEQFDEVMVSTDSKEYREIARQYGANVPFLRSKENSSDRAESWDMVREVIDCYSGLGQMFESFCLLQPTSPLRTVSNIIEAYELFRKKNAVAVVSLCEMEHSPLWCNVLEEGRSLEAFICESDSRPRQLLDTYYRINGAIYIANIKEFFKNPFLYRKGSYAYIMDKMSSVDIDDELDFKLAEILLSKQSC